MSEVVADQDVRDRITRHGLGETLFVEAGAGTGKTSQLVERIVHLVLDEHIRLADIAAITFTEAAAAELQDRIRVAFEKTEAEHAATDPDIATRCREAIADADLAAISTLHGFAKRILSEHPVAAGLPPRVDILDEVRSQLAREERWERFVDAVHSDPANEELLVLATLVDVSLEPQYPNHATMKDIAVELGQSWDLLDDVADMVHGPFPPIDITPFADAIREVEALYDECLDPGDLLCVKLDEILPRMRRIRDLDDREQQLTALSQQPDWGPGGGGKTANWKLDVKEAKGRIRAVNDAKQAVLGTVRDAVLRRLLTLVAAEVRDAAEARRLEGELEFHDLLVLARRLLRTSPDARASLHERYQRLLLDEFQDTDPIQIEIAVLIAGAVAGDPPPWSDTEVGDGRLFFVGDPKQSIYRFRRADITLFLQARDRFSDDGEPLALRTNFRTVPEVLEWVNGIFGQLMPDEVADKQPKYEPLDAHRTGAPGTDHRPVLLGRPWEKARALELRQAEAADVARAIDDIRTDPAAWPVHDAETERWRPAALSDITILVPTRTSLPYLRDALDDRAIPYRLDTGTLVYDTQEVRDALAVVRAVDDPTDELSLVAALRSPLYACSDVDLFTYRDAGGRWDIRAAEAPPEDLAADHPVVQAMSHLHALWDGRWWTSPSQLLERALRERQAFVLGFGDARPKEVWRRLRFLLDQAQAFEEAGGGGLRAFVEWAELQRAEGARVHEPLLPETDDVAVRILTIHGAKGLEFPITILSGMTTKPGGARRGVSVLWKDGEPSVRIKKGVATDNHDPRADIELEMDEYEKLRLLYVACTRARDHLMVACHHKENDESYANRVWMHAQTEPDTWRQLPDEEARPPEVAVPRTVPLPIDDRERWIAAREAVLAPQRETRFISATTLAHEVAEMTLAPEDDDDADEQPAVDDDGLLPRRRGRAGTAIGRAVHATLQLTDLADPTGIDEQAVRQADLEAVPEHAELVAAMVRSALDADAIRSAAASTHHKELYVAAPVGRRVIEGYIDLLVETADGLVIIDYKTDTVRSAAEVDDKLAAYEVQGAAYAVALEESTGLPVVDCRFVFCRSAGAIERSVADLAAVKQRIRDLAV